MGNDDSSNAEVRALPIDKKVMVATELMSAAARDYGRVLYASSLGAEAIVLIDLIFAHVPQIDVISIDTGRLHEETYALLATLEKRYHRRIRVVSPEPRALEEMVSRHGINGFYESLSARVACCEARKIAPFRRAIEGYGAWVTGIRRDQSTVRAQSAPIEWDRENHLYKISPLLDWGRAEIWRYIRTRHLPYNPLHDQQYLSIGCAPCTRAVRPGEHERAGRWWWEESEHKECGLHPKARVGSDEH